MAEGSHIGIVLCSSQSPTNENGSFWKGTNAILLGRDFGRRAMHVSSMKHMVAWETLVPANPHGDVGAVHGEREL